MFHVRAAKLRAALEDVRDVRVEEEEVHGGFWLNQAVNNKGGIR